MSPEPRLRDLTERRLRIRVEVDASPVYELLLSLWALESGEDLSAQEVGIEWFEELRSKLSPELTDEVGFLSTSAGTLWMSLLGLVHEAPSREVDEVLTWLAALDPVAVRHHLLTHKDFGCDDETCGRAAAGDEEAVAEAVSRPAGSEKRGWQDNLGRLLELPPDELPARLAAALRRFHDEAFAEHAKAFAVPLARDAEAKRALAATTDPERLIEMATNGVEYRLDAGSSTLVLVPSVVLRPWSLLTQRDGTLILCYPVADEHLEADPDAPPAWLVKTYKALGDERRLRILRRLGAGSATLDELAELVGLAKSTVHHHVGILRAAGLVRVTVPSEKEPSQYRLRRDVVPEAARLLDGYLSRSGDEETSPDTQQGART